MERHKRHGSGVSKLTAAGSARATPTPRHPHRPAPACLLPATPSWARLRAAGAIGAGATAGSMLPTASLSGLVICSEIMVWIWAEYRRKRHATLAGSLDRSAQRLLIGKPGAAVEVKSDGAGAWFAHLDDVRAAGATEMRRALARAAADSLGEGETLLVSNIPYCSLFDHETSLAETISFSSGADGLRINIDCWVEAVRSNL